MPITPTSGRLLERASGSGIAAGFGLVLLMVLCCAGPALIAAGALAGIGAWLSNPWVIAAAAVLAVAAVTTVVVRACSRRQSCCPPTGRDLSHDRASDAGAGNECEIHSRSAGIDVRAQRALPVARRARSRRPPSRTPGSRGSESLVRWIVTAVHARYVAPRMVV